MTLNEDNVNNILDYIQINKRKLINKENEKKSKIIAAKLINKITYNYWKMHTFWNYKIYNIEKYKFIYRKENMGNSYDKLRMYNLISNEKYNKLKKLYKNYNGNNTYTQMINELNIVQLNCIGW